MLRLEDWQATSASSLRAVAILRRNTIALSGLIAGLSLRVPQSQPSA